MAPQNVCARPCPSRLSPYQEGGHKLRNIKTCPPKPSGCDTWFRSALKALRCVQVTNPPAVRRHLAQKGNLWRWDAAASTSDLLRTELSSSTSSSSFLLARCFVIRCCVTASVRKHWPSVCGFLLWRKHRNRGAQVEQEGERTGRCPSHRRCHLYDPHLFYFLPLPLLLPATCFLCAVRVEFSAVLYLEGLCPTRQGQRLFVLLAYMHTNTQDSWHDVVLEDMLWNRLFTCCHVSWALETPGPQNTFMNQIIDCTQQVLSRETTFKKPCRNNISVQVGKDDMGSDNISVDIDNYHDKCLICIFFLV